MSSAALSRLTGTPPPGLLSLAYSLFGAGAGLINPVITAGVMSAIPRSQAGLASGINSSSRQLGQSLGVAVIGTVLAGSLHGPMQSGFIQAAHAGWLILALACGSAVLAIGLLTTSRQARTAAAHAGQGPARRQPGPAARQAPGQAALTPAPAEVGRRHQPAAARTCPPCRAPPGRACCTGHGMPALAARYP